MKIHLQPRLGTKIISAIIGLSFFITVSPAEAGIKFNLPSGLGFPGRRVPAASRGGNCLPTNMPLTAIVPKSNVGLTTVGDPTLFFFIPQTPAPALELVLQDDQDEVVYKQTYKPSGKPGVVGLRLPANSLAVGKQYKWSFSVICNAKDRAKDKLVQGAIQRINEPELMSKLEQATPDQRLSIYAEAGIWQDTLTTFSELLESRPTDAALKADWEALLTTEGIGFDQQLAQAPLTQEQDLPQPISPVSATP